MFIKLTDAYADAVYFNVNNILAVQEWEGYRKQIRAKINVHGESFYVQESAVEVMEIIGGMKPDRIFKVAKEGSQ